MPGGAGAKPASLFGSPEIRAGFVCRSFAPHRQPMDSWKSLPRLGRSCQGHRTAVIISLMRDGQPRLGTRRDDRVGLRCSPAKRVWGETSTEGSNPSLSANFFGGPDGNPVSRPRVGFGGHAPVVGGQSRPGAGSPAAAARVVVGAPAQLWELCRLCPHSDGAGAHVAGKMTGLGSAIPGFAWRGLEDLFLSLSSVAVGVPMNLLGVLPI